MEMTADKMVSCRRVVVGAEHEARLISQSCSIAVSIAFEKLPGLAKRSRLRIEITHGKAIPEAIFTSFPTKLWANVLLEREGVAPLGTCSLKHLGVLCDQAMREEARSGTISRQFCRKRQSITAITDTANDDFGGRG